MDARKICSCKFTLLDITDGSDDPAHTCSLVRAFASRIHKVYSRESQLGRLKEAFASMR